MSKIISSKHLESVSDLTLSAPVKQGFIDAFEAVTYETRLRKVLEALFKIRATAREHSKIKPFVETAERIQSLLDFRLAIVDSRPPRLLLSATFDRPFEPYMRLIWDPLGPLLDLIFCNCEGYVTATDHSFEEYLAWVRSAQIDTDFFYTMSGHSVNDLKYLLELERLDRKDPWKSSTLVYVEDPDTVAAKVRKEYDFDSKLLGVEALVALYKLTDFYPPDQPKGDGRFLRLSTQQLLKGWDVDLKHPLAALVREQLPWFLQGRAELSEAEAKAKQAEEESCKEARRRKAKEKKRPEQPEKDLEDQRRASLSRINYDPKEIQGGIVSDYGDWRAGKRILRGRRKADDWQPPRIRHGALLLMRIVDPEKARKFIGGLKITTEAWRPPNRQSWPTLFCNLAFTRRGLANIGVPEAELARFPQEFHEGMEARAGLLGDLRYLHPRNWTLPSRNWPPKGSERPEARPVDMSEVDIVIQLRTSERFKKGSDIDSGDDAILTDCNHPLFEEVKTYDKRAESGVELLAVQAMRRVSGDDDLHGKDHFGFRDGFSQPKPVDDTPCRRMDEVARGELLWGYPNDRSDPPPSPSDILDNGTFLVVRKLRQHVKALKDFAKNQPGLEVERHEDRKIDEEKFYGKMMGRTREGDPMMPGQTSQSNDFDYGGDPYGVNCPLQAHIRRANPRAPREGMTRRPTPRIMRRGLSYGPRFVAGSNEKTDRGVVFMAYSASIAEQYEVIQRWVNGGNPTAIGSWLSDPMMGFYQDESECAVPPLDQPLQPKGHEYGEGGRVLNPGIKVGKEQCESDHGRTFRFRYWYRKFDKLEEPAFDEKATPARQGRFRTVRIKVPQAFVELQWGTYLFVPSMKAIKTIARWPNNPARAGLAGEGSEAAAGEAIVARLLKQAAEGPEGRRAAAAAWKTYLEDFSSKDPGERAEGPTVWAAIRRNHGGALRVPYGIVPKGVDPPDVVLAASKDLVMRVFRDPDGHYSMCGHMIRMKQSFGEIYLGMDEGDTYWQKSRANEPIFDLEENKAFEVARDEADKWLIRVITNSGTIYRDRPIKLDLRRDFITPVLGMVCNRWFGIPDLTTQTFVALGGWGWGPAGSRKPRCPGDYMATSRYCFYPDPVPRVQAYGREQGQALRRAVRAYFDEFRKPDKPGHGLAGELAPQIAKLEYPEGVLVYPTNDELARTIIGVMTGFLPPADGSLRWTLYDWIEEKKIWRVQHDLIRYPAKSGTKPEQEYERARYALRPWLERAMQKRPSPDILWRTATCDHRLGGVEVKTDDKVIIGIVSALAEDAAAGITDVYPIFGGERGPEDAPLHACPAHKAAMGTMLGILSALLERCRIEALPSPLIITITDLHPLRPPSPAGPAKRSPNQRNPAAPAQGGAGPVPGRRNRKPAPRTEG